MKKFTFVANKSCSSNWQLLFTRVNNRIVIDLCWGENSPAHTIEVTREEFAELSEDMLQVASGEGDVK